MLGLGLDCSLNKTGWCLVSLSDGKLLGQGKFVPIDLHSGSLNEDRRVKQIQTAEFLAEIVLTHDIGLIAFESEAYKSKGSSLVTLARNMGFVLGYLYTLCGEDVQTIEISPSEAKAVAKSGTADKIEMVNAFRDWTGVKLEEGQEDIADAYFVLMAGIRKYQPRNSKAAQ